jgi:hypothetical protein
MTTISPPVHPELDYSGRPFAAPNPALLSRSWRLKRGGLLAPAAYSVVTTDLSTSAAVLFGQDSTQVSELTAGLAVYAGYNFGGFANWQELVARFLKSGARLVSITPAVTSGSAVLDIEPGNASPSAAPSFQRIHFTGEITRPTYYCSAGDTQAVINALSGAGFARDTYYIWSAHWIGEHICSPATCGYPQADATQYDSISAYDSDAFYAYMFAAVKPPAPPTPPKPPAPAAWSYPAPQHLTATGGETSVRLNWVRNLGGHPIPDHYVVWIYKPGPTTAANLAGTGTSKYPRSSIAGDAVTWEGGGLERNVKGYTVHLSASGEGGEHLGKDVFAKATFDTN